MHFSVIYELLGNQELDDNVKVILTTWYFNVLMTQYNNQCWIEHFCISKKLVQHFTLKLLTIMEKKTLSFD